MLDRARRTILTVLAALALAAPVALATTGCKSDPEAVKASLESEIKEDIDQIELKAGKLPMEKTQILAKTQEFKKELETVKGDNTKLRKLRDRVDKYAQEVAKMSDRSMGAAPGGVVPPPQGNKLGGTGTTGAGGMGTTPGGTMGGTGGKMGGTGGTMGGGTGGKMGGTGTMGGGTGGTMGGGTGGTMGGGTGGTMGGGTGGTMGGGTGGKMGGK